MAIVFWGDLSRITNVSQTWCAWGVAPDMYILHGKHISPPIHHHIVIFILLLISFPYLLQVPYLLFLFVYSMHRLTYSHLPHEWIRNACKSIRFFPLNEQQTTNNKLHPRLPLHFVPSLKFRVSTQNTNFDHISYFRHASSPPSELCLLHLVLSACKLKVLLKP